MENNYHIIVKRNEKIYAEGHYVSEETILNMLETYRGETVSVWSQPDDLMFGELITFIEEVKEHYKEGSDLKLDPSYKIHAYNILDYILKYAKRLEEEYE